MTAGKCAAQAAHASMAFLRDRLTEIADGYDSGNKRTTHEIPLSERETYWFDSGCTKICLQVNSEAELMGIYEMAARANLEAHFIKDAGKTEFKEPTITCCAIGPDDATKIDAITGHLKLY